ncbi:MAG: hypothetical protein Alpg2KO_21850 [Alphaproteobacteria bacterium]
MGLTGVFTVEAPEYDHAYKMGMSDQKRVLNVRLDFLEDVHSFEGHHSPDGIWLMQEESLKLLELLQSASSFARFSEADNRESVVSMHGFEEQRGWLLQNCDLPDQTSSQSSAQTNTRPYQ